jgi:hypothetical protein
MDLQSDQKWALSVRTCIRACTVVVHKAIPWLPRTGCCSAMASNVAQFKDKDFGQSMDWDASLPWCCPFCHRSGKISHHGRPRFCIGTRSQLYFDLWRKRVRILRMTRTTAGLEDSSRILTVSVLQGSQVAPGCQCPGYGRDLNVYIHTYIHSPSRNPQHAVDVARQALLKCHRCLLRLQWLQSLVVVLVGHSCIRHAI